VTPEEKARLENERAAADAVREQARAKSEKERIERANELAQKIIDAARNTK
jgi:hypothetical protein